MTDRAAGLTGLVLGAAAGGGFPQWNCGCRQCALVRAGDLRARPSTQASVAVSGNGAEWVVVGASPDLRQQILQTPRLWPRTPGRDSPIAGVVLIGGDVDAIAGLLVLRERQKLTVYAPRPLLDLLDANRIFDVLDASMVRRVAIAPQEPVPCGGGLTLTLLTMPGKVPLYLEERGAMQPEPGPNYAALLQANGRSVIVAPACADITDAVRRQLRPADLLFFDGTLFTDDEMVTAGLGEKTGRRMGHVPVSGPGGTLEGLSDLPGRRILLHINNTNPILILDSPERRQVEAAGIEIAYDGMEVQV
ncbi:MAG TPA: pyrroloquinoline quinone biosynthesis protein PqqB [Acetobacteraceae bacterium]|jgi:pyrroloquinoline quinone biosynthesis protein B|nr:pyrroloquinoline quinone biosynthesis protein PqqB [Acetobacteraceae bacterium]